MLAVGRGHVGIFVDDNVEISLRLGQQGSPISFVGGILPGDRLHPEVVAEAVRGLASDVAVRALHGSLHQVADPAALVARPPLAEVEAEAAELGVVEVIFVNQEADVLVQRIAQGPGQQQDPGEVGGIGGVGLDEGHGLIPEPLDVDVVGIVGWLNLGHILTGPMQLDVESLAADGDLQPDRRVAGGQRERRVVGRAAQGEGQQEADGRDHGEIPGARG